jgi:excisionase family DNA binding protein
MRSAQWFTTKEAAELLRYNGKDPEQAVRRLIRQKRLRAANRGTDRRPVYLVSEDAIDEFLSAAA